MPKVTPSLSLLIATVTVITLTWGCDWVSVERVCKGSVLLLLFLLMRLGCISLLVNGVFWQALVITCTSWRTLHVFLGIFWKQLKFTCLKFSWKATLVRSCRLSCQRNSLQNLKSFSIILSVIKMRSALTVLERQLLHLRKCSWSEFLNYDLFALLLIISACSIRLIWRYEIWRDVLFSTRDDEFYDIGTPQHSWGRKISDRFYQWCQSLSSSLKISFLSWLPIG